MTEKNLLYQKSPGKDHLLTRKERLKRLGLSVITNPAFILLGVAILSYWPLSFMVATLKWDVLDVVFPWRHFVGECLQNGIFPFWNPYQATGYPIHADLQCPTFFPELWIVGILTGYNIYIMHFLFVFYIFIAGYGMFKLTYFFNHKQTEALIAGIAFMLCGFFVSHGQHFFAIVGGAFIPFVLLFYVKTMVKPGVKNTLAAAVFIFLLITGGYQTLSIITAYLLLTVFLFYFIRHLKKKESIYTLLKHQLLLGLLVILLILVVVVPVIQVSDFSGRYLHGVSPGKSSLYPFSPQSLISLLLPFSTVKNPEFFRTDFSMNNLYFGLLMLIVFVYGLLKAKKGFEKTLLVFGLISLLASFGNYLPVRRFLFNYLPFMNQFRMPGYFSYFAVFSFIFSAGIHLPDFFHSFQKNRKQILYISIPMVLFFLGAILFASPKINFRNSAFLSSGLNLPAIFKNSTFYEHLFLQSLIQLSVLSCFVFLLLKSKSTTSFRKSFILLAVLEMIIAINLNGTFTVWSPPSPRQIHKTLSSNPRGFPLPDLSDPIITNGDLEMKQSPFWRNMGNWTKRISFDAFSSFPADRYQLLDDSLPYVRDAILNNPVVYTSGHILPYDSLIHSGRENINSNNIYLSPRQYRKLSALHLKDSKEDRIRLLTFQPGNIDLTYQTRDTTLLNLLQSDYRGWQVFIDDRPVLHFTGNYLYISTLIPPGNHRVRFTYFNKAVFAGFIISYSVLIILLLVLSYYWGKNRSILKRILYPFAILMATLILFLLYKHRDPVSKKQKFVTSHFVLKLKEWEAKYGADNLTILMNTDDSTYFINQYNKPGLLHFIRFKTPGETKSLYHIIEKCNTPYFIYGNMNLYEPPGSSEFIKLIYPCRIETLKEFNSHLTLFQKGFHCVEPNPLFQTIQNFESHHADWTEEPTHKDSTLAWEGKFSYRMDSTSVYSPAFIKKFADLSSSGTCFFVISAEVWASQGATPFLVFQTKRNGVLNQWNGLDVSNFINYKVENWEKVIYIFNANRNIRKKEKIEIYFWNKGGKPTWVDQFAISTYSVK